MSYEDDEVSTLNDLKKIPKDEFCKNEAKTNWMKISMEMGPFRSCTSCSASFFFLFRLVTHLSNVCFLLYQLNEPMKETGLMKKGQISATS